MAQVDDAASWICDSVDCGWGQSLAGRRIAHWLKVAVGLPAKKVGGRESDLTTRKQVRGGLKSETRP
ncbi:hypothetical protein E4U58_004317 [Claviceps cyperi]|nr:hypothetical protein E4U58_004317 [Claviceps cyperi]